MPVHDWSRVGAGIFHDFHIAWIVEIRNALNGGQLPPDYYALSETAGGRQRTLAIRHSHSSGDRVVALVEIVSPGNKHNQQNFDDLLHKILSALAQGFHLLLIDLQPRSPRDPQGIHGAVWGRLNDIPYAAPPDKSLTLVGYAAGLQTTAYVEPVAVGDRLADMPLFLDPEHYVSVPLEATYQAAYRGVPQRWRKVLET